MSEEQDTMKWGDILRIHGVSTIPGKECKGLIISKGYFCVHQVSPIPISTIKLISNTRTLTFIENRSSRSFRKAISICTTSCSWKKMSKKRSVMP